MSSVGRTIISLAPLLAQWNLHWYHVFWAAWIQTHVLAIGLYVFPLLHRSFATPAQNTAHLIWEAMGTYTIHKKRAARGQLSKLTNSQNSASCCQSQIPTSRFSITRRISIFYQWKWWAQEMRFCHLTGKNKVLFKKNHNHSKKICPLTDLTIRVEKVIWW